MREIKFRTLEGSQCQFTGLYDKNDKEIFEGDILKLHMPSGDFVRAVQWDEDGCWMAGWSFKEMFCCREFTSGRGHGEVPEWRCEVIGNIYETPELLPIDQRALDMRQPA